MIVGKMLEYLESIDNVTIRELARGLCSESYIGKVKRGERNLSAVHFIFIIQRLYLSPSRFCIGITQKECNLLLWLQNCHKLIAERKYEALYETISEDLSHIRIASCRMLIDRELLYYRYIILREVEKKPNDALNTLKKTIDYMLDSQGRLTPGRYSAEELNRFMNYVELSQTQGKMRKEEAYNCFEQIRAMVRLTGRDPREEARIYPRIACYSLRTVGESYPYEVWKAMLKEALESQIRTGSCYDLPELLKLLTKAYWELKDASAKQTEHWHKAFCDAYEIAEMDPGFNRYDAHDRQCQLYFISSFLRESRLRTKGKNGRPFSQEYVSEGIMEPTNYTKLETGKYTPKRKSLERIAAKLNISPEIYRGEIVTFYPGDFSLVSDIRRASNNGDIELLQDSLGILSKHLDRKYPENKQFLDGASLDIEILKGQLPLEKSIDRLISILEYTMPYSCDSDHVLSTLELELIYRIVRNKRICALMTAEDVSILMGHLKKEEDDLFSTWERKGLIKRLAAGILQVNGQLQESEYCARECIKEMLMEQKGSLLAGCLDVLAESIVDSDPVMAKRLIQAAYWASSLYRNEINKTGLNALYKQLYGEDIAV
ncbi:MAG: hypothetical protein IJL98_09495 [Lachnospiraceae bacterium]|nr:hypothetical protein [Lachnospiraceae bacterium]